MRADFSNFSNSEDLKNLKKRENGEENSNLACDIISKERFIFRAKKYGRE